MMSEQMSASKIAGCYFCGEPATSRDHVVPSCFFPSGSTARRIKVPACHEHNNLLAEDEEYFRTILTAGIWNPSPVVRDVIDQRVKPSFQSGNPQILRTLQSATKDFYLPTPNGFVRSGILTLDDERMDRVAEKIVRGLHFHLTRRLMPAEVKWSFHWQPKDALMDLAMKGRVINVDPEVFTCRYQMTQEPPFASIWWMGFYRKLLYVVTAIEPRPATIAE
jgi:hypothetical protein